MVRGSNSTDQCSHQRPRFSHLNNMGKTNNQEIFSPQHPIAQKNLKKFMVIFHMNIHLREFFQIFLSNRAVEKKFPNFFPPCYVRACRWSNWTLSSYGIFFIIFLETTSDGRAKKKMNLVNKECPNNYVSPCTFLLPQCGFNSSKKKTLNSGSFGRIFNVNTL